MRAFLRLRTALGSRQLNALLTSLNIWFTVHLTPHTQRQGIQMTGNQFRELCSAIGIAVIALLVVSVAAVSTFWLYQLVLMVVA